MEAEAAVAIVQAGHAPGAVLLIRRAERAGDSWSGHWSLPGGRRDPEDPDALHTALRELAEECGIRLTPDHLQAPLPPTLARRQTPPYLLVAPFLFRVDAEPATTLDPREAAHSIWMPVSDMLDPRRHALRPVPGRPSSMLFPSIELDGPPLWGFTYRLLTDWLGLNCPGESGLHAAETVLRFLTSLGVPMSYVWKEGTAAVRGPIPVAEVLSEFGKPGTHVSALNCLEVTPEQIRILGPEFEEYRIISDTSEFPRTPRA